MWAKCCARTGADLGAGVGEGLRSTPAHATTCGRWPEGPAVAAVTPPSTPSAAAPSDPAAPGTSVLLSPPAPLDPRGLKAVSCHLLDLAPADLGLPGPLTELPAARPCLGVLLLRVLILPLSALIPLPLPEGPPAPALEAPWTPRFGLLLLLFSSSPSGWSGLRSSISSSRYLLLFSLVARARARASSSWRRTCSLEATCKA